MRAKARASISIGGLQARPECGLTVALLLDVAFKTVLVAGSLLLPGQTDLVPESHCGIERAPAGTVRKVVAWGDSLGKILVDAGTHREEVAKLRRAIRREHNLNTLAVGDQMDIHVRADGAISWFRYRPHLTTAICARRDLRDELVVHREELEARTETVLVETAIPGGLRDALEAVGEDATLALLVDDLFPMDVARSKTDENRYLRVVVERRTIEGQLLDYGRILAAEYKAEHKDLFAFHYSGTNGSGYYDQDGNPMQSTRLRSPVPGATMTSGYGYRKHPIRRRRRMHRGVDYSAARGAAVRAAAPGVVISAQWEGPLGKMVAIRHRGGLVTHYAHLSGFSKRARPGQRLEQGTVIGYVGSTGLSTGAHLHFETLVDKKYIDPMRLAAAQAPALSKEELEDFHAEVQRLLTLLDPRGQVGRDA